MIVNVPVVDPAATVTLDGTVAALLFDCKVTTVPPDGAAPPRITVPVELAPPATVVGLRVNDVSACGLTVNVAEALAPPSEELMLTGVLAPTANVVIAKVADVAFAATVTVAGTVATAVFALVSVTMVPPDGAGPVRVTVPVEDAPPMTTVGLRLNPLSVAGLTVRLANLLADP